jgi:hypothetical protein
LNGEVTDGERLVATKARVRIVSYLTPPHPDVLQERRYRLEHLTTVGWKKDDGHAFATQAAAASFIARRAEFEYDATDNIIL